MLKEATLPRLQIILLVRLSEILLVPQLTILEVGYLAELIHTIEKHVFEYRLTSKNPTTAYLSCLASFAPDVPKSLKNAILGHGLPDKVLEFMKSARDSRALVHTSTAVDIVGGGVKSKMDTQQFQAFPMSETNQLSYSKRIARDCLRID